MQGTLFGAGALPPAGRLRVTRPSTTEYVPAFAGWRAHCADWRALEIPLMGLSAELPRAVVTAAAQIDLSSSLGSLSVRSVRQPRFAALAHEVPASHALDACAHHVTSSNRSNS